MKIRSGFVSNSSSSSFVVAFPHMPKDKEDLRMMLFNKDEEYIGPWGDQSFDIEQIVDIVLNDIEKQCPNDMMKIGSAMEGYGMYDDVTAPKDPYDQKGFHKLSQAEQDKLLNEFYRETEKFAMEKTRQFMNTHNGCLVYVFDYSDNDGELMSAMEHGSLFMRLPHIRISHH